MALSTNQFKNGNHIEVDGTVFKILDFQHVKPGKGGAFVRTKLRRASDGNVIDRTFRAGEKFRSVRTESRKMQFLYADGSDAHFMDTESFEQIAVAESARRGGAALVHAEQRGGRAVHRRRARATFSCRAPWTSRSPRPTPGCAATRSRAAARSPRRSRPARSFRCRCSSSRASGSAWTRARATTSRAPRMRRSEQRRAAVIALYQHDLTGRPLAEVLGPRDSLFARALASAAAERAQELDEVIDRHAHGWSVTADPAAGAEHHARGAGRDAAPRRGAGRDADPGGGGDRGGRGERQEVLRRGRPGFVNGVLDAALREVRENAADPMSSAEHLDELIARLERAAEQLRSGELLPGRGRDAGRGLRRAGQPRPRRSSSSSRAREVSAPAPGQDTLL